MANPLPLPPAKRCTKCNAIKPLNQFGEAPGHIAGYFRRESCIHCAAEMWYTRTSGGALADPNNFAKAAVRKVVNNPSIEVPHICEITEDIFRELTDRFPERGRQAFAHEFWDAFFDAKEEKSGGIAHQRFFGLLHQFIKGSTEHRKSAPDMELQTEEELRGEIARIALDAVPVEALLEKALTTATEEQLVAAAGRIGLRVYREPDAESA